MSTPSKAQDPAAAALSAIEDALKLNIEAEPVAAEAAPETGDAPKLDFHLPNARPELSEPLTPRLPEVAADELPARPREGEAPRAAFPPAARPANDDRPSV